MKRAFASIFCIFTLCLPALFAAMPARAADAASERRIKSLTNSAFQLCREGKYREALPIFKQITWLKPDSLFFQLQYMKTFLQLPDYPNCEREGLKGIEMMAKQKVQYARFYLVLLDCYICSRQIPKARALTLKCLQLFPHRPDLITELRSKTSALRDSELDKKIRVALLAAQEKEAPGNVKLANLAVDPKAASEPGMGVEMLVNSSCFTRFKLFLGRDRLRGSSGVIAYNLVGPNYNKITLIDDESRNYLPLTLDEFLKTHCANLEPMSFYRDITKIGNKKVGKYDCELYKCDIYDESSYDILQVCRQIKVEPGLAAAICDVSFCTRLKVLPLKLENHYMDTTKVLQEVTSMREIELPAIRAGAPAGYNKSANMTEFTYAQDGKMQLQDVDQMLATPQSRWTAPGKQTRNQQ